jgi:hypothetical protein
LGNEVGYNPEQLEQLVKEYMARFYKSYKIPRHDIEQIELWCRTSLGREFRDWSLYKGHVKDPHASLSIVDPKWCTIFELKFSDYILGTIDRSPNR